MIGTIWNDSSSSYRSRYPSYLINMVWHDWHDRFLFFKIKEKEIWKGFDLSVITSESRFPSLEIISGQPVILLD